MLIGSIRNHNQRLTWMASPAQLIQRFHDPIIGAGSSPFSKSIPNSSSNTFVIGGEINDSEHFMMESHVANLIHRMARIHQRKHGDLGLVNLTAFAHTAALV